MGSLRNLVGIARGQIWFLGGINLIFGRTKPMLFSSLTVEKMAKPIVEEGPWSSPASGEIVKERGRIRAEHLAASAGAFQGQRGYRLPEIRIALVVPDSGWSDAAWRLFSGG